MTIFGFVVLGIPLALAIAALSVREIRRELGEDGVAFQACLAPARGMLVPYFGTTALCLVGHFLAVWVALRTAEPAHGLSQATSFIPVFVESVYLGLLAGIVFPSKYWVIPNTFTLSGILAAPFAAIVVPGAFAQDSPIPLGGFLSCILGIAFCFAIPFGLDSLGMRLLAKPLLGFGTIKHLTLAGALLGPVKGLACFVLFLCLTPVAGLFRRDLTYVPTGLTVTLSAYLIYAFADGLLVYFR